jgi:predicted restriction endonuclease
MKGLECSCDQFERLEGAGVPAYISAFLEQFHRSNGVQQNHYRCRVCGREWEKRGPRVDAEGVRPSLVRLN